jgi:hypothetical protein
MEIRKTILFLVLGLGLCLCVQTALAKSKIETIDDFLVAAEMVDRSSKALHSVGESINEATRYTNYWRELSGLPANPLPIDPKVVGIAGSVEKWAGPVSSALKGLSGALRAIESLSAGEYRATTDEAFGTAGSLVGSIAGRSVGAHFGAFAGASLLGGVCGAVSLGVGAVPCAMVGGAVGSVLFGVIGGAAGAWAGRTFGTAVGDAVHVAFVNDTCVDARQGFGRASCSLIKRFLMKSPIPPSNAAGTVDETGSSSSGEITAGGIRVAPSLAGGGQVNAGNISTNVHIGGSVTTLAEPGQSASTRIGSTSGTTGSQEINGSYTTSIGGSIINQGGTLEINPIQSCSMRRNGQCCMEMHNGYCVISRITLAAMQMRCPSNYEQFGRQCYLYSDKRHRVSN